MFIPSPPPPPPAGPKPGLTDEQRAAVQNHAIQNDLMKTAMKSTHVLNVVKTGTGVLTEKQRKLQEEEERKQKAAADRYRNDEY